MSIQRGTVYQLHGASPDLVGVLVLTNDAWNRAMDDVVVLPLRAPRAEASLLAPIVSETPALQTICGHPGTFPRDRLGRPLLVAAPERLAEVEECLCELLLLRELLGPRPERPRPLPGPVTYPRWGEVYYIVGQRYGGQRKRYVVVSRDGWNHADGTAIAVRTTSQPHRHGDVFPAIQQGRASACCADAAAFSARRFDYRDRPNPYYLSLTDMAAIARGLVAAFALEDAVARQRN